MKIPERRKYKRFPVVKRLSEPVDISIVPPESGNVATIPGVIVDIGAGGMGLITFAPIPENSEIILNWDLPALGKAEIRAKTAWIKHKRGVYQMGLEFTRIPQEISMRLMEMGNAFAECFSKVSKGEAHNCDDRCPCYLICDSPVKKKVSQENPSQ